MSEYFKVFCTIKCLNGCFAIVVQSYSAVQKLLLSMRKLCAHKKNKQITFQLSEIFNYSAFRLVFALFNIVESSLIYISLFGWLTGWMIIFGTRF